MTDARWHLVQQHPELRRFKVICAGNPPKGTIGSFAEMGEALREKERMEKNA